MITPRSFYESVVTSPVDFLRVGDFGGDWCLGNPDFAFVLSVKVKNKKQSVTNSVALQVYREVGIIIISTLVIRTNAPSAQTKRGNRAITFISFTVG